MVDKKTVKDIVLGAAVNGIADGAIEVFYNQTFPQYQNVFPFIRPLPYLPPIDDWLVAGIPGVAYAYTRRKKREGNNMLLGAFLYGLGMFIHNTIVNAHHDIVWGFAPAKIQATRYTARPATTPTARSAHTRSAVSKYVIV